MAAIPALQPGQAGCSYRPGRVSIAPEAFNMRVAMSVSSIPSTPDSSADWPRIAIVVATGIAAALQIGKVPAAIPLLRAEFGFDLTMAAVLISMLTLTSALVGMGMGLVADRFGQKRLVLIGIGLNAVAGLFAIWGGGLGMLLFSRFLESIAFISITVSGPSLILRLSKGPAQRQAIAFWSCYMPAGTATMMLLALPSLETLGWRGFWLIGAALNLGVGVAFYRMLAILPDQRSQTRGLADIWASIRLTVTSPGPVLLSTIFAAYAANYITVFGLLTSWLIDRFGIEPGLAAAVTGIGVVSNVIGNLSTGWLLNHGVTRAQICAISGLVLAVLCTAIYLLPLSLGAVVVLLVVFSSVCGLVPAACFSGVGPHAPSPGLIAATNGLIMQGSQAGQLIIPPIAGRLVETTGQWPALLWVLVPLFLAVTLFSLMLGRLERKTAGRVGTG